MSKLQFGGLLIFIYICIMGFIGWITGSDKREKEREELRKFNATLQQESNKIEAKQKQYYTDLETVFALKAEVQKYLREWTEAKRHHDELFKDYKESEIPPFIWLKDWNRGIYMIYDEETAKFKEKGSLDKFREDYLKELKQLNNIE